MSLSDTRSQVSRGRHPGDERSSDKETGDRPIGGGPPSRLSDKKKQQKNRRAIEGKSVPRIGTLFTARR